MCTTRKSCKVDAFVHACVCVCTGERHAKLQQQQQQQHSCSAVKAKKAAGHALCTFVSALQALWKMTP